MSITNLNLDELKAALTGAWQKDLNTSEDPANGRWYVNGANNDGIGLYGNLTDTLPTGLNFDQTKLIYVPTQVSIMSALVDNRNGLTPNATVTLSKSYTESTTITHTITNAIKVAASVALKSGVEFKIVKGESTVTFSIEYSFTYASATATEESEQHWFSEAVPVSVPTGKLYKVVLTGSAERIQVPFTAYVTVSGVTETWFEDRINGHYNWSVPAGTAFAWINQHATAGNDSVNYGVYPQNPSMGAVMIHGMLNYQTVANFQAETYDITPASHDANVGATAKRAVGPSEPISEGILVTRVPLGQTQAKAAGQ